MLLLSFLTKQRCNGTQLNKFLCSFRTNGKRKQNKFRFNAEEATQFILDLPSDSDMSDLDELSGDEGVNDFNEDENVYNEDPEHHSDTETESLMYCIFFRRLRKQLFSSISIPILKGTI